MAEGARKRCIVVEKDLIGLFQLRVAEVCAPLFAVDKALFIGVAHGRIAVPVTLLQGDEGVQRQNQSMPGAFAQVSPWDIFHQKIRLARRLSRGVDLGNAAARVLE